MRRISHALPLTALAVLISAIAGCSDAADNTEGSATQQIKGAGSADASYPEAVLINARNSGDTKHTWKCSGTVIAPKVVLTSGICAGSHVSWTITAPSGGKTATSTSAAAYKWSRNAKGHTDIKAHNIGLIFLDAAIRLAEYPVLSDRQITSTEKAVAIGRTNQKKVSDTEAFVSDPLVLRPSSSADFPFDYTSAHVVDPGDSGGAQELVGSKPHMIVSVTSKIAGAQDTFSRVDQADVAEWIQQQVEAHGGFATDKPGSDPGRPPPTDAGGRTTPEDSGGFALPDSSTGTGTDSGTTPTGPTPEQACLDTAVGVAINAADCGEDYATQYQAFIDAAAGGDCKNITSIRDSASLYNTCLPSLNTIACDQLIAGNIDPSCIDQLVR